MRIYIDQSGDLGWKLDKPNRAGGSSRFITITGILISSEQEKYIIRFIRSIYKKYNLTPNIEKKGANFSPEHSRFITSQLNKITNKADSFKIISITVNKAKVYESLRKDKNIFYNYILGVLVRQHIISQEKIDVIIDKRTIKVSHGQSFPDYIKTQIWSEGYDVDINCEFVDSSNDKMIWFADWYANFIWRFYEDKEDSTYSQLKKTFFIERKQFFQKQP